MKRLWEERTGKLRKTALISLCLPTPFGFLFKNFNVCLLFHTRFHTKHSGTKLAPTGENIDEIFALKRKKKK